MKSTLMNFCEGQRIMSRDYLAFHVDIRVKDAVNKIKDMARRKT
ncbi:MAG: hypothetical protein ACYSR1_01770 [Planctomycetota bacterium]